MCKYIINGEIVCEKCKKESCHIYDTDEVEFNYDGTGHYYVDVYCNECKHGFREYFSFKYELVK